MAPTPQKTGAIIKDKVTNFQFYYIDGIKNKILAIITNQKNKVFFLSKRQIKDLANKIATVKDKASSKGKSFTHSFQDDKDLQPILLEALQESNNNPNPTASFQYAIVNVEKKQVVLVEIKYKVIVDNTQLNRGDITDEYGIRINFDDFLEIGERFSFNFADASSNVSNVFENSDDLFT